MRLLARWCDAVELWVTGLPYVLQVTLVLVVLTAVAVVVVRVLTAVIDRVAAMMPDRPLAPTNGSGSTGELRDGTR